MLVPVVRCQNTSSSQLSDHGIVFYHYFRDRSVNEDPVVAADRLVKRIREKAERTSALKRKARQDMER